MNRVTLGFVLGLELLLMCLLIASSLLCNNDFTHSAKRVKSAA